MRILVIIPLVGKTAFELGGYCRSALCELGHQVSSFDYSDNRISYRLSFFSGIERAVVGRRLCKTISKFKPELILVVKGDRLSKDIINEIRKDFRGKLVNYWIDDPYRLSVSKKLSPLYDYFSTNAAVSVQAHK